MIEIRIPMTGNEEVGVGTYQTPTEQGLRFTAPSTYVLVALSAAIAKAANEVT